MRATLVALTVLCASAVPGAATAQAGDALMRQHAALQRLLGRTESPRRQARLTRMLDAAIDYDTITRRVLVLHWGTLEADQQGEVSELLRQAIRHRYRRSVDALRGWDVQVIEERPRGPGVRVVTRATRGAESRNIEYDMYYAGGSWRVVDFIVEGESLIHQYRVQFGHVIRRNGFGGFLGRLRARVEADEA